MRHGRDGIGGGNKKGEGDGKVPDEVIWKRVEEIVEKGTGEGEKSLGGLATFLAGR